MATIQMHATPGDCWLVYYGDVYDMTQYAPTHPASSTLITNHCGTDATAAYASVHSRGLLGIVNSYKLGALEEAVTSGPPPSGSNGGNPTSRPTPPPTNPPPSPTPPPSSSSNGGIAMATVQMHARAGDCWLVYYGVVYDMTQYAPRHPASSTLITNHCGTDATAAYASVHSRGLLGIVNSYKLGALEGGGGTAPAPTPPSAPTGPMISMATIQQHARSGDCWLAYYDGVYDMTQYAPRHPARASLITNHCGTDATFAYASAHSRALLASVEGYKLGAYEGADPSTFPIGNMNSDSESSED